MFRRNKNTDDIEDDFVITEAADNADGSSQATSSSQTASSTHDSGQALSKTAFHRKERLSPDDIYYSEIGMVENGGFELVGIIKNPGRYQAIQPEFGRVYRKFPGGRLYILYHPGKDNDTPALPGDLVEPLKNIRSHVDAIVKDNFGDSEFKRAKKLYAICENNTYLGVEIAHYVKADEDRGVLTIDDSINRNYDISNIASQFPGKQVRLIKRGWQNMLLDKWTCGHFTLEALRREIMSEPDPQKLEINEEILRRHFADYKKGKRSTGPELTLAARNEARTRLLSSDDDNDDGADEDQDDMNFDEPESSDFNQHKHTLSAMSVFLDGRVITHPDNVSLPVKGRAGSSHITADQLEEILIKSTGDKNLDILTHEDQSLERIYVRVMTEKHIPAFKALGIKRRETDHGHHYYELTIPLSERENSNYQPLFGIPCIADHETRYLDISHVLSASDIRQHRPVRPPAHLDETRARRNSLRHSQDNSLLPHLKAINQYLTRRAGETSGFLSSFLNSRCGQDYYLRRKSWLNILNQMVEASRPENGAEVGQLAPFIRREAARFKGISVSKNRFYRLLINLANALDGNEIGLCQPGLAERVNQYQQIYASMQVYRRQTEHYISQHSMFRKPSDSTIQNVRRENSLYAVHYNLLHDDDKADFLNPNQEHVSEYRNSVNL